MPKLRSSYQAILFDVGDTLLIRDPPGYMVFADRCWQIGLSVDQANAHSACRKSEFWIGEQILREMQGAPRMSDDKLYLHLDFVALQSAFGDRTEDEIWHLATRLREIPHQNQEWALADGVHETLTRLQTAGSRLGIVSNFDEALLDLCDRFGLTAYFDIIIASSLVGVEKPDPEILHIACRRIGVSPSKSLYVGDHPFDVLCAKESGMSVAWLCEPSDVLPESISYQPDYRIQLIDDILMIREVKAAD